jgi:hypothetical protein
MKSDKRLFREIEKIVDDRARWKYEQTETWPLIRGLLARIEVGIGWLSYVSAIPK